MEQLFQINSPAENNRLLFLAASNGDLTKVKQLLDEGHCNVNAGDELFSTTALHFAARRAHADIVRFLLSKGANVNVDNIVGSTPLHYAAGNNSHECLRILVENGANVNVQNTEFGATPLHVCASHGFKESACLLLELGADITIKEKQVGATAQEIAQFNDYCELALLLEPYMYAAHHPWTLKTNDRFPLRLQEQVRALQLYHNQDARDNTACSGIWSLPWEIIEVIISMLAVSQYKHGKNRKRIQNQRPNSPAG